MRIKIIPRKLEAAKFIHYNKVNWSEIDYLLLSPGIALKYPKPHHIVAFARNSKCQIIGDIDVFKNIINKKSEIIAVTGTNGKSTDC